MSDVLQKKKKLQIFTFYLIFQENNKSVESHFFKIYLTPMKSIEQKFSST